MWGVRCFLSGGEMGATEPRHQSTENHSTKNQSTEPEQLPSAEEYGDSEVDQAIEKWAAR